MKTVKILLLITAFTLLGFDGCKTHKNIQVSKQNTAKVVIDSSSLKKVTESIDSTAKATHVAKEAKTVEEYTETNIIIRADREPKTIDVPGFLHLDSTSTLDTVKLGNDKVPKSTLSIYRDGDMASAKLHTPDGEQTFKNFSSIEINTKKYKKTTTGKSDSSANKVVNKILKNSIDSGTKHVDSAKVVIEKESIVKDTKTSFWSLIAGFWWIPLTVIAVAVIIWKWPSILSFFKRK